MAIAMNVNNYFKLGIIFALLLSGFALIDKAGAHSGRTNSAGCHNDNINGGYHCHNGGSSSYSSSSCTFNGIKYPSSISAHTAYEEVLYKAIDNVYLRDLERKATYSDYHWWEERLNAYSLGQILSCKWLGFSETSIHEEVIKSVEYQQFLQTKAEAQKLNEFKAQIRQAYIQVLERNATNQEIDSIAEIEKNNQDIVIVKSYLRTTDEYQKKNDWLGYYANKYKWWIIIILGYAFFAGVQYFIDNKPSKK